MSLPAEYLRVRGVTERLLDGLTAEDCLLQSMADVSPPKWHLGHTTWFFETFLLEPHLPGYRPFDPRFKELFNSYYDSIGPQHPRFERGHLSRPSLAEVGEYRRYVDRAMMALLETPRPVAEVLKLGLNHEQQHQELWVMDVKYNFSVNPLAPAYRSPVPGPCSPAVPLGFDRFEGGAFAFGAREEDFAFDNERPVHRRIVEPFELGRRLVNNQEMLEFVRDGGYRTSSLWLSDGWAWVKKLGIESPLYWRTAPDGEQREFTVYGEVQLDPHAPVCHVSGYEAAAFATWAGARLPTEFEWELAASTVSAEGARWLEDGLWQPRSAADHGLAQLFGDAWEWTRSAYEPYPGYFPLAGAIGEYNGKFMCNQWVLRGGSAVTPRGHVRATYRNFFYPHQRWPYAGIRLARDAR